MVRSRSISFAETLQTQQNESTIISSTSAVKSNRKQSWDGLSSNARSNNNNATTTSDDCPATQLWEMVSHLRHTSTGRTIFHQTHHWALCHVLLRLRHEFILQEQQEQQKHLQQQDETHGCDRLHKVSQAYKTLTDWESGYTPLHWALYQRHLGMILVLLRQGTNRLAQPPLQLLYQQEQQQSLIVLDGEGHSPVQILGQLQIPHLKHCRKALYDIPRLILMATIGENASSRRFRTRSNSFSFQDNADDDDDEARASIFASLQDPNLRMPSNVSLDVLTFGRNHHNNPVASNKLHRQDKPQRVSLFSRKRNLDKNVPVQVVAAHHHTLICTKQGTVWAYGLGRGGRLGNGSEQSLVQPLPVTLRSSSPVIHVAAAEHHSLCCTLDGQVFAWGSNRYGQLGCVVGSITNSAKGCFKAHPIKVNDLSDIVAVAAGEKHSVALSRQGRVYCWGDNSHGQLGRRYSPSLRAAGGGGGSSFSSSSTSAWIQPVDSLQDKVVIFIAASEQSTSVIVRPHVHQSSNNKKKSQGRYLHNLIYSWGHGNPLPLRVNFDSTKPVNPISMDSARHHNVAITQDGQIYIWGPKASSSSLVMASRVHLDAHVVGVSTSEHSTAVVTDQGHLYTWGEDVMGHEGIRYQPCPKRVPGVHRAVQVAVGKEQTVLLMGTVHPDLPHETDSLLNKSARVVARHVDLFNVVPLTIMAQRTHCQMLKDYCNEFIRLNLDGVLVMGRKSEFDIYLREHVMEESSSFAMMDSDDNVHPLVLDIVRVGQQSNNAQEWKQGCQKLLDSLPISTLVLYGNWTQQRKRRRASSFHELLKMSQEQEQQQTTRVARRVLQAGYQGCSERCLVLTANLDMKTEEEFKAKHSCLSKEIRGIKKRLHQIAKLLVKQELALEERDKVARKPLLEADLAHLKTTLQKVERLMEERNIGIRRERTKSISEENPDPSEQHNDNVVATSCLKVDDAKSVDEVPIQQQQQQLYRCEICCVNCSDASNLELHKNGRKHRNRLAQVQEEEKKQAAKIMMEEKRLQSMTKAQNGPSPPTTKKSSNPWGSVQPRYQLPPPPHAPMPRASPLPGKTENRQESNAVATASMKRMDLRSIFAEEEKKKRQVPSPLDGKKKSGIKGTIKINTTPTSKKQISKKFTENEKSFSLKIGSIPPPMKSPPWASAPHVVVSSPSVASVSTPMSPPTSGKSALNNNNGTSASGGDTPKKQTLQDFFIPVTASPSPKTKSSVAPWSASSNLSPSPSNNENNNKTVGAAVVSFKEIQQEEEAFQAQSTRPRSSSLSSSSFAVKSSSLVGGDAMVSKWYVARTERAHSLSKIQADEAKEREERLLREQEEAEAAAAIAAVQAAEKKMAERKKKSRNRGRHKKKNNNNKNKEQQLNGDKPKKEGNAARQPKKTRQKRGQSKKDKEIKSSDDPSSPSTCPQTQPSQE